MKWGNGGRALSKALRRSGATFGEGAWQMKRGAKAGSASRASKLEASLALLVCGK
jgi:hypothetical protein